MLHGNRKQSRIRLNLNRIKAVDLILWLYIREEHKKDQVGLQSTEKRSENVSPVEVSTVLHRASVCNNTYDVLPLFSFIFFFNKLFCPRVCGYIPYCTKTNLFSFAETE